MKSKESFDKLGLQEFKTVPTFDFGEIFNKDNSDRTHKGSKEEGTFSMTHPLVLKKVLVLKKGEAEDHQ